MKSSLVGSNQTVGSNRRGFLGFLGLGVAAGPNVVQEALASKSLPNLGIDEFKTALNATGSVKGRSNLSYFKSGDEGCDENDGYTYKYLDNLRNKLEAQAKVEFLKKNGPTPEMRIQAGFFAAKHVNAGILPSHIKHLKSFSDSRKERMSYEFYFIRHLQQQVEEIVYSIENSRQQNKLETYQTLFKKTRASFLGKTLRRIL